MGGMRQRKHRRGGVCEREVNGGVKLVKFWFMLKRRGVVSLDSWGFNPFRMDRLWQRRVTTDGVEGAESCFLSLFPLYPRGFPKPRFWNMVKNLLDHTGDDHTKSREKFEQAFMDVFGRIEDGSAKPPGRLQQMFKRILLWVDQIG